MGLYTAAFFLGVLISTATESSTMISEVNCITGLGETYRGTIAVTKTGKTCQSWSSQTPHTHDRTPENYPFKDLRGNLCRNPDGYREGPWCYTTDPDTRWELCNIPSCSHECMVCNGEDYKGKISTTENGYTCQRWDSQEPHNHGYSPSTLPGKHLEENYCRNPSGDPRPWCFTTNPAKRWDFCSISRCNTDPPTIIPEVNCITGLGVAYRGTIAITKTGKTCQSWSSQTPHTHDRTPENYSCKDLRGNLCRNPDGYREGPWCYTTDPDTRWELCNIPSCSHECMVCNGEDYKGKISTTENGYTCQRWDSQEPHNHGYSPSTLPGKHLEENYCRNPSGDPRPWCFTTNPAKRWDFCSISRCNTDPPTIIPEVNCITGVGVAYRGTIAITKTGKTCQSWSSQMPHTHDRTPENYSCKDLRGNLCRNPDGYREGPWCYTTDPDTRWELCNIPSCSHECMVCNGEDYKGKISTTENGYTCQRWDSQEPHNHGYSPSTLPGKHLEENYCRNPSGDPRPWCFTTNPAKRWDFCSISRCNTDPPTIIPEVNCITGVGVAYRGTIAITKTGKTCQSWSSQMPHTHDRTPENYSCKDLRGNLCRNPDGYREGPWCYTTDPDTHWELCNIPSCSHECMVCNGEDYKGKISTTENGYTCQRWDSQEPHNHGYSPSTLPGKHLEENYCRNPSGDPRPWCFTTNPAKRWDFCSISRCNTEPPTIIPEVNCITGLGVAYRGMIAVTKTGKTCQSWSSQTPHTHDRTPENYSCKDLRGNLCRNPDGYREGPWCYTTDPNTRWELCNIPSCSHECMVCNGEDYKGKISTTENGYTCQRWDSQEPHNHGYSPSTLPGKHLEENYCRNPSGDPRPWCFTTNPAKRWDFCSISRCNTDPPTIIPEVNCITGLGVAYRGMIAVTKTGKTCQSWSSQTPHTHDRTPENYSCKGLDDNYCRNPDGQKKPWCYTTDPDTRWEYCNVLRCGDTPAPDNPVITPH